jgi:hypothetical protein
MALLPLKFRHTDALSTAQKLHEQHPSAVDTLAPLPKPKRIRAQSSELRATTTTTTGPESTSIAVDHKIHDLWMEFAKENKKYKEGEESNFRMFSRASAPSLRLVIHHQTPHISWENTHIAKMIEPVRLWPVDHTSALEINQRRAVWTGWTGYYSFASAPQLAVFQAR